MELHWIGYFPKRTERNLAPYTDYGIQEICAISDCISKSPEHWLHHWRHNELFLYDTPALAWGVAGEVNAPGFDLYAYRMPALSFVSGQAVPFEIPAMPVTPPLDGWDRLGFDIANRFAGTAFECSPLTCNLMAELIPVNQYGLVDTLETALPCGRAFEAQGCEPGPYFILEVWRQRKS